jgi:hypothetical protein
MAKDLEQRGRGTVAPIATGGDQLMPFVPAPRSSGSGATDKDYLAVRPPANGRIQAKWSAIITPYRATLHFRLWITFTWWRVMLLVSVIIGVIVLIKIA